MGWRILLWLCVMAFMVSGVSYAGDDQSLITAAYVGDISEVNELLAKGADVNVKNNNGWTALHEASMKGHGDIVQLLKKAGAR